MLVFALILYLTGPEKIISAILSADYPLLALAVLLYLLVNLAMSYRIKVVLQSMGDRHGLSGVFPSNMAGMLASDFTPARAGYFFTAFSLSSKLGIPLEKTLISIFGPQLFDFLIKVTSASLLLLLLLSKSGIENVLLNALLVAAFLAAIIFAGLLVFYPPLLKRLSFLEPLPFAKKAFNFLKKMHEHSHLVWAIKGRIALITFASWAFKGAEWFAIARALGISITGDPLQDFLIVMVFQAAVTILQFLPLPTIAGAGASEAGFAALLLPFGIPLEQSISFGFLTRLLMIVVDTILGLPVILDYLHRHSLESSLKSVLGVEH